MQAVFNTAAAGISGALKRFEDSAARTAQAPLDNIAKETVERLQASTQLAVNVAVLRTAQDMTRALLDIKV